MKTVLITGVDGFTGKFLAKEFEKAGWVVIGVGLRELSYRKNYYQCDLFNENKLLSIILDSKPNTVVHLAAESSVAHSNIREINKININGTYALLSSLHRSGLNFESILLASSANVYGNTNAGLIDESTTVMPVNDYAVSKLSMEFMARLWLDKLPIFFVRPFNYTGIGQAQNFLVPKIVSHFKRRSDIIELGNVDVFRDYSDVRSVVDAYRRLIEVRPVGEVINICAGNSYSIMDIIEFLRNHTKHNMEIKINPLFVRDNEIKILAGDNTKLIGLIGGLEFQNFEDTLLWMLEDII